MCSGSSSLRHADNSLYRQFLHTNKQKAKINMSHVMRKLVYAICEQQRRRSACTSAEQAGLSLYWSQTRKGGFLMTWLIEGDVGFLLNSSEIIVHISNLCWSESLSNLRTYLKKHSPTLQGILDIS